MSDLVEYPAGGEFPGVIGRTVQESSPAWPPPARAKDGAPNVLFFVLDDVGYGQLSCFGGLVDTPNIDRVAASGLRYANMHTTALCSPTRSTHPHRPQPSLQRRRVHPGAGHRLSRLRRADAGRERHARRDAGARGLQRVLPRQVASVAGGGEHAGRPVPSLAARPRLRALLRLPRRRDQPVVSRPHARQQPDAGAEGPRGRLPPERGPRRPGDQDDARRARQRAREAVLHVLLDRRRARAAPRPQGVGRPLQGSLRRRLGRLPRDRVRQPEGDRAAAGRRAALAARSRRPGVVVAVRRRAAAVRADDGGLRGLRGTRRPPLRPHPRHARADRRARQHADHGHLRQRRLGRGRRHRLVQRDALLQPGAGELRGQPRAHRRPRRPVVLLPLRVGLGVGRSTRRSGAGSARPTAAARPTRSSSPGRPGWRPAARSAPSTRTRSTWCRPCSTRSASTRRRRSAA